MEVLAGKSLYESHRDLLNEAWGLDLPPWDALGSELKREWAEHAHTIQIEREEISSTC